MNWFSYLIQSNLYLIIFYGFYWLLLRKETFNNYNRAYLVLSALVSFGIPLWNSEMIQNWLVTQKATEVFMGIRIDQNLLTSPQIIEKYTFNDYMAIIYGIITIVFGIKFLLNITKLYSMMDNFESLNKAFSFFDRIFISNGIDPDDIIYDHERVHARHLHSIDVLFFEIIGIFCWFNPIVIAYKIAIKNIHEFIADEIASEKLPSKFDYAMLLFSEQFQTNPSVLVSNFFSKTSLKLRIMMLNKERSNKVALLKYGMIFPVFLAMMVFTSAAIARGEKISELLSLGKKKFVEGLVLNYENKPIVGATVVDIDTYKSTTSGPDGWFKLPATGTQANLVFSHVSYRTKPLKVLAENAVTVTLRRYTNELLSAVVLSSADNKVSSSLNNSNEAEADNYQPDNKVIEQTAQFVGGPSALYAYLKANLRYPEEAKRNKKQGVVYTKFVINENGEISNVRTASPLGYIGFLGYGLEEEARRVVANMPKWKPARQNGIVENADFTLPIQFILDDSLDPGTLYLLDGKKITKEEAESPTLTSKIDKIESIRGPYAVAKYGSEAKNGVIALSSKVGLNKLKMSDFLGIKVKLDTIDKNSEIFSVVDQQAEFPGGVGAMGKYLSSNIRYPIYAQRDNVVGKVFLSFIVGKTGEIKDINILKGITAELNEEAIRVVGSMPHWIPAQQNGIAVNSKFNLPIEFRLKNIKNRKYEEKDIHKPSQNIVIEADKLPIKTPIFSNLEITPKNAFDKALFIVNDKIVSIEEFNSLDPNKIKSMTVLKNGKAEKKYGKKGKNGVIIVELK